MTLVPDVMLGLVELCRPLAGADEAVVFVRATDGPACSRHAPGYLVLERRARGATGPPGEVGVLTSRKGRPARGRGLAVLLTCIAPALFAAAGPAAAKPPAPGAPGAIHTWAPADKHGFGTARQHAGNAYLTLRKASLTEVYYPDLSTPSFRGLQFAITDGTTFVDRETVDDDPRHIEPVAPGVTATVEPLRRSLGFRQVTRTARWKLTKTWIADPSRATVLARVRFESLTGRKLRLYVLADPAPGDDGNDDRSDPSSRRLLAFDEAAASAVAAEPPLHQTSSGYRGTTSDPWRDLQGD